MNPEIYIVIAACILVAAFLFTLRHICDKSEKRDRQATSQFIADLETCMRAETEPQIRIELLGGPLDGTEMLMPKDSIGYCDEATARAGRYVFTVADRKMIS
jgi:hypothetical protein